MMGATFSPFRATEAVKMVQRLLLAGMLSGLIVAVAAFGFARVFSEPIVERAIALEEQMAHGHDHDHEQTVSRSTQRNLGLFTGLASYCIALGGILAIGLACLHGRLAIGARPTVWTLAALGYISLVLVPQLKYPASPPGVGTADTIGSRTELFFLLLLLSAVSMIVSVLIGLRLRRHMGRMFALTAGVLVFACSTLVLTTSFPGVSEVPRDFPKGLLVVFRMNSAILQLIVWAGLALVFGQLSLRVLNAWAPRSQADAEVPNG
jgi:hypothetical protein